MASSLFKTTFITRMHDIDAAGVMFFGRIFYYAHDAYEALLNHHQQSINIILNTDVILPISHAEADFKAAIYLNETIEIEILVQDIREKEFSLSYHFIDSSGTIRATALTRHVCLENQTRCQKALPDTIIRILK